MALDGSYERFGIRDQLDRFLLVVGSIQLMVLLLFFHCIARYEDALQCRVLNGWKN
jgi:hypothetical protein